MMWHSKKKTLFWKLDFCFHSPVKEFKAPTKFGQTECYRVAPSVRPISVSALKLGQLRIETDLVSKLLLLSEFWTLDKATEARNSTC
jgi:hypothetical protein